MKMKKGQTGTEYLIVLAVIIIVALIIVGVVGGFESKQVETNSTDTFPTKFNRYDYAKEQCKIACGGSLSEAMIDFDKTIKCTCRPDQRRIVVDWYGLESNFTQNN